MKAAASRLGFVVAPLLVVVLAPAARAGKLPAWLSIADTRRAPVQNIPPIAPERLEALEAEKQAWVERLQRVEYDLRADGIVEQRIVHARQLLSEDGVQRAGTLTLSARAATDRVFIDEAYVLSPEGRRLPFDPKTLQIAVEEESDLFHDVYGVALPFAELEVRSTVVLAFRIQRDTRRWPLPWSGIQDTQRFAPSERLEIDVRWAAGLPPPVWKTDDPKLACRTAERRLTCSKQAIDGLTSDPEVASWSDLTPQFAISEAMSWPKLVAIERKLLDPGDDSGALQGLAVRLLRNVHGRAAQVEALFRFVADDIRYVGFEHGRSAVTPHRPAVTLARRFGDCKDKVALFLALARRAGLDAYPVLVATNHREPAKLLLPSWKYFDHIIACVGPDAGSDDRTTMCLDPTAPSMPAGILPFGVRTAVAVPLVPGGRPGHLPNGEGVDGYGWRIEIETRNEIACDGTTKETLVRRYHGAGAGFMRAKLRSDNVAVRRRWLEDAYAEVMGKKVKVEVSVDGLDTPTTPVELRSVASYPGTRALIEMKEWNDGDPWLVDIGQDFRTDNRNHPFALSGLSLTSETTYEFCPSVSARFASAELKFQSEFGSLTREQTRKDGRPVVRTVLKLPPQTIAHDKLARFNKFIDVVLAQTPLWYGLEPAHLGMR